MTEQVALLDTINPAASAAFEAANFEVVKFEKSISIDAFADLARQVDALALRSGPDVPAEVILAGDKLQAIGCFCVGTNHVDRDAANEAGVAIFNSVHENTRSVAELVIANTFSLMRRTAEHSRAMHDGTWTKTDDQSFEVRGKTMGIIGYGGIGGQVAVIAEAVGMDVVYFDPNPQIPPQGRSKRLDSMEAVLAVADVTTLHVPGGRHTKGMINEMTIAGMKRGAYLINTSRGDVVDYEAVAVAIENGQMGGVAADVFVDEPKKKGDEFDHVLRGVGKAILTPHIGGSTTEAQSNIGSVVAIKLMSYLSTGSSAGSVNLPELGLNGLAPNQTRILNIHDDVVGASANINAIIAESGLNIAGTQLKTRASSPEKSLGYVAFDLEGEVSPDMVEAIQQLETSRRTRVIC